jgi:hypothetical protein
MSVGEPSGERPGLIAGDLLGQVSRDEGSRAPAVPAEVDHLAGFGLIDKVREAGTSLADRDL